MEILVASPVESSWCMVQCNLQPNSTHSGSELRMQLKAVAIIQVISDVFPSMATVMRAARWIVTKSRLPYLRLSRVSY